MIYAPNAGDLIWTDSDPRTGREQSGRRPALVVSPSEFYQATEFAIRAARPVPVWDLAENL